MLMRGPTRGQSNHSRKIEIYNYYYQWQNLNPSGKRKAKMSITISVKTPEGREEEATLKSKKEWLVSVDLRDKN
jgi:hypothetical protein